MTVSYHLSGGARTGIPQSEWLSVDGDAFEAWRTTGARAAGHFGGSLTADEAARLNAAVAACESAEPAHPPIPLPGATTVLVAIDGTSFQYGSGSPPPGPWAKLDAVLSELCDAIVDRPTAAIAIEAGDDGTYLVHRGDAPIAVDLTGGTFVAIAYSGWYHEEGRSEGDLTGGEVTAGPGWTETISIGELTVDDPDSDIDGGVKVHVIARFTLGEGRDATPVEVALTPELERPD
ncbi:MAG: hypothetical protein ACRDZZ_15475 [Ilumatobacteraceae bacterium]